MLNARQEIEKVVRIPAGYGVLNIQESVFYPAENQAVLEFGFETDKEYIDNISLNSGFRKVKFFEYGHFLKNEAYVGLCRKSASIFKRSVCLAGYPVVMPLRCFQKPFDIIFWVRLGEWQVGIKVAVRISGMSPEKPYACIKARADLSGPHFNGAERCGLNGWTFSTSEADYFLGNPFNWRERSDIPKAIDLDPNFSKADSFPDFSIATFGMVNTHIWDSDPTIEVAAEPLV